MLNKVLKKMREDAKKAGKVDSDAPKSTYPLPQMNKGTGFHAKKNSQEGAERQRSMGNRNTKPAR